MIDFTLLALSVALVLFGTAIFWRQSGVTSCPRHSNFAGGVATVLASAIVVVGIALAVYAVLLGGT